MLNYANIAFTVLFSQNLLLIFAFAFGADPKIFTRPKHAFLSGCALTLMLTILAPLSRLVDHVLYHLGFSYFSLLAYGLLACLGTYGLAWCVKQVGRDFWPVVADSLMAMPTNGGILAVFILSAQQNYRWDEALVFGFFAGVGVTVALVSLVGIRQSSDEQQIPKYMQGLPILFITAGLMSLAVIGFFGFQFR